MAAAGYDVAAGDIWALNEISSAVRQGTGSARANMRDFLDGLYDGDGVLPVARGAVFVIGIAQGTADLSALPGAAAGLVRGRSSSGATSAAYVSDWSQEVYGDVRQLRGRRREPRGPARRCSTSTCSTSRARRRRAGQPRRPRRSSARPTARSRTPPGSRTPRFGFTDVPVELMQDYVSAQTYATRSAGNSRFGFAWSPKNLAGIPTADFNAQTDAILVRLAAAIADSGEAPEGACGANWCTAQPRRRRAHDRLAHVRNLEAVPARVHLPRADGLAREHRRRR